MKITLDIPDGIIAGFFNGVEVTAHGMQLVSYQLSTDDLKDGNIVKLQKKIGTAWTWFLTTSRQSSLQTTP